tara:strand:- start:3528 stop:3842 length:315 start_codon:yes stop_codon:yes gene_type:complete
MPLNKKQTAIKNALGGNLFPQTGIDNRLSDADRKIAEQGRVAANQLGGKLLPKIGIDDRLSDVDRKAVKKRGRQAKRAIKADGRLSDVDRKTMLKAARRTFRLK